MLRMTLKAARGPLAIVATALVTLALAACADDQLSTAPRAHPNPSGVAERNITTLASDSTLVTFSPEREGKIYSNGYVGIIGTEACSRDLGESFTVVVTVEQDRRDGDLVSSAQYGRTCPSQGGAVQFFIPPVTGGPFFKRGKAVVTFEVIGGAPLVIHSIESRSVRLVEVK